MQATCCAWVDQISCVRICQIWNQNNAVAPGGVETDMLKDAAEDNKQFVETLRSTHPIGRIANPEEIGNAVVWLLSDKASFVLGHTLIVDGGFISR